MEIEIGSLKVNLSTKLKLITPLKSTAFYLGGVTFSPRRGWVYTPVQGGVASTANTLQAISKLLDHLNMILPEGLKEE